MDDQPDWMTISRVETLIFLVCFHIHTFAIKSLKDIVDVSFGIFLINGFLNAQSSLVLIKVTKYCQA